MLAIAILALLLTLAACGRGRNQETSDNGTDATPVHTTETTLPQGTHNLTVSASIRDEPAIRRATENLQESLPAGVYLNVNILYYSMEDTIAHYAQILHQLQNGTGPDIILWGMTAPNFYRFAESGLLADLYALIDASPTTQRQDFFTDALEAYEIGGQLLKMPTRFGFEFIGINENVPPSIANRFGQFDYATPSTLLEIYFDLIQNYPQWHDYGFLMPFEAQGLFTRERDQRICFATGQVDLSGLEPLLENLRIAQANDSVEFTTDLELLQQEYVFHSTSNTMYAMFEFEPQPFVNYIPIATESGHLAQRSFIMGEASITTQANPWLAWALLEEFMAYEAGGDNRFGTDIPALRRYFNQAMDTGIGHSINFHQQGGLARDFIVPSRFDIDDAIARLENYSQKPAVPPWNFLLPLMGDRYHISDAFFAFLYDNEYTAADALSQMEAEILYWINAERVDEPIIEEEELPCNLHLPARTLTFHGNAEHSAVAEQAAAAMNQSWIARDEPYRFELILDTFPAHDWDNINMEARATRFATMLMAGDGPDIFVYDRFYDIHALAASGLIMDFATLIDNCSVTSRADFFTQPLDAFSLNGGWYLFPTNFSYQYVAINTSLPPSIINRFTSYDTITMLQMMDIYLELKENYPDEFGHMYLGLANSAGGGGVTRIVAAEMGRYIDLDGRTSDLTNPDFINFLEMLLQAADGRTFVMGAVGGTMSQDFIEQFVPDYVFTVHSSSWMQKMYFTPNTAHFYHPRLLTDYQGRLLLDIIWDQSTWSALGVTAAGDYNLAWELIRYMVAAYTQPVGRARGQWGQAFGDHYIGSPILRELFYDHSRRAFDTFLNTSFDGITPHYMRFVGLDDPYERERQVAAAIERIAVYNEQPMAMLSPMLPGSLFADNLDLFLRRVITPQEFAQRTQNAVTLWLLEQ